MKMDHSLSWKKLLSPARAKRSSEPYAGEKPAVKSAVKAVGQSGDSGDDERTPFEQDYDRIVFSPPFRKLARKTQVHPMANNDFIHNRLTHSIEVASVGRSFAGKIVRLAQERSDLEKKDAPALPWIMQSACLIHDLGNPPFGHAGENLIRAWTEGHLELMFPNNGEFESNEQRENCTADWLNFEGNAQGFRLSARPDNYLSGYLRLTSATLFAAIKYPWLSTDDRTKTKQKHNVYTSEADVFYEIAENLGLLQLPGQVCRHPLSFLTEAADDICYRMLDLEDAVEMGICKKEEVHKLFLKISGEQGNHWMALSQLRGQAIKSLIDQFWKVFVDNFDAIMNGDRVDDLKSSLEASCQQDFDQVSQMYLDIFGHRKKVATELGAYHVLGRIMKSLFKTIQSIHQSKTYEEVHFISKRCIELTWGKEHAEKNMKKSFDWWHRQVMDFMSGLTDDYATRLSREIGGFSLDAK